MKLMIVAMLLTVVQAPAPAPKTTSGSTAVKPPSPASQQSPPITNTVQPNSTEAPKADDQPQSIKVRELPPVTVVPPKKNFWDKFYIYLTAALVLIGIGTLGAIWYQAVKTRDAAEATSISARAAQQSLTILERQTAATEIAANAARDNIELFINKERARLRVGLEKLNLEPEAEGAYIVNFKITIHGTTEAFITDAQGVAGFLPLEHINHTDYVPFMYKIRVPDVISPNSEPIEDFAIFGGGDTDVINEIKLDRLFVYIRGFIKYKDVFDKERETSFRYVWKYSKYSPVGDLSRFGEWEKCGAAEDNLQT